MVYRHNRGKELAVGSFRECSEYGDHIAGEETAERREPLHHLEFCCSSALSEKVLMIFWHFGIC
jgi:hypothetical protein